MRILIAEDEPGILRIYKLFLEAEGFEVTATSDGTFCMDQYMFSNLNDTPFDIVILDYRMPRKNGRQVIEEIVKINPDQTIIMITAYQQEMMDYEEFRNVRVFLKPFDPDDLTELLKKLDLDKKNPLEAHSIFLQCFSKHAVHILHLAR